MENKESGIPQELLGKIRLLVFLEGLESWARDSWRKNPRLIEFYKMSRLSQVASILRIMTGMTPRGIPGEKEGRCRPLTERTSDSLQLLQGTGLS